MRIFQSKPIKEFWKILKIKDDESFNLIKEATFNVTFVISLFFGLFYSVLYYFLGAYNTSLSEFGIILILFPTVHFFRKIGKYYLSANLFIVTYVLVLNTCGYFTGGLYSPSTLWLIISPFLASVFLGTKELLFWGVVTIVNILIVGMLSLNGFFPPNEIINYVEEFHIFSFVALVIFIFGFMIVTNYMRLTILQKSNLFKKEAQRNEYLATFAQVTAGLAHEVNNPLMIALGRSKRLVKGIELEELGPRDILGSSYKIMESIERISKIIVSMKNLSRDGNNDELSKFSVQDYVEDVTNIFYSSFEEQSIVLETRYNDCENLQINAHRTQLGQVLFNLLKNSFDEIINLDKKEITIDVSQREQLLLIKVFDSGNGIKKELIDKIFSPFYSTKIVGKGTGLGLSLSLSMMKKNGGNLYVDTNSTKTCFVIEVPCY